MEIQHEITNSKGRFYMKDKNELAAEMTYSKAGNDKIIIDHTEVSEQYKGQKLGLKLVEAAVEFARINKLKIMPLCPFARKMFERHKEFVDVLW